jgi:DNA polymerase
MQPSAANIPDRPPSARELLAFYLEAGVDCALLEEPPNRLTDPDIAPVPVARVTTDRKVLKPSEPVAAPRADALPTPEVAIASAREAAGTAPTLEALRTLLENLEGCAQKTTATRLLFADGNPHPLVK